MSVIDFGLLYFGLMNNFFEFLSMLINFSDLEFDLYLYLDLNLDLDINVYFSQKPDLLSTHSSC